MRWIINIECEGKNANNNTKDNNELIQVVRVLDSLNKWSNVLVWTSAYENNSIERKNQHFTTYKFIDKD
jgi:predicted transposase YbfD/YdcC